MYVCMYVCMYIHTYIHTHIFLERLICYDSSVSTRSVPTLAIKRQRIKKNCMLFDPMRLKFMIGELIGEPVPYA